jgi:integrase
MSTDKALALVVRGTDWSETSRIATSRHLESRRLSRCREVMDGSGIDETHVSRKRGSALDMPRTPKPWYRASEDTWYASVSGRQVSLKVRGKQNEPEAWSAWHSLRARCAGEPEPTACATVRELLDRFLDDCRGRARPKTVEVYAYFLRHFAEACGAKLAVLVTPQWVEHAALKPSWSPSTRNDFVGAVATAFRWGERCRVIPRNPLWSVRRPPKGSRGAKAVLTAEQVEKLLAAATPAFRVLLRLLWLTGARPAEIYGLTAADVNLASGVAVIERHKTADATGRARVIHLPVEAVELLRPLAERHPDGPLVRNNLGDPWNEDAVVCAMKLTRRRAGIPTATCYGLRHSFATDALANGVPEAHVAELLGHSGTAMLHKHYSHLGTRATALRAALGRVRA